MDQAQPVLLAIALAITAILLAARWNPALRIFYQRLRAAGKPAKLALAAVGRKLLALLNAILRDRRPWHYLEA